MNRTASFRWVWLVLAAVMICVPAFAQDCVYDGYSTCYSDLDIDGYGHLAGVSVTEVPYYYGLFGYYAEIQGYLEGPSGQVDYEVGYDDGVGYAEADTSGTASSNGSYSEFGYHWLTYYYDPGEDMELGGTEADGNWSGSGGSGGCEDCPYPTSETSVYTGADDSDGYYSGTFYGTLTPNANYTGRLVKEYVNITGEDCNYYLGGPYPAISNNNGNFFDGYVWTADGDEYAGDGDVDYVYLDQPRVNYYMMYLGLEGNPTECWGFYGTQAMSINDCIFTNDFTEYDGGHSIGYLLNWSSAATTAYRGGASGPGW